jgi:SAM-dependent methyltransferase
MLTVDFDRLGVTARTRVLDLGCGGGRHAFEAWRRGARVVALDMSEADLKEVRGFMLAMLEAHEIAPDDAVATSGIGGPVNGDALALPFADAIFDCVIASEVLEHVWADEAAIAELVRVLRPEGRIAVTVPTRWPERVCWALDHRYHDTPGGHIRIYRQRDLEAKLERAGLWLRGSHHAHALHAPYWWLKCATDVTAIEPPWIVRRYHDLLAWQITDQPRWLNEIDRLLNPVLGKSLVVYGQKAA